MSGNDLDWDWDSAELGSMDESQLIEIWDYLMGDWFDSQFDEWFGSDIDYDNSEVSTGGRKIRSLHKVSLCSPHQIWMPACWQGDKLHPINQSAVPMTCGVEIVAICKLSRIVDKDFFGMIPFDSV